MKVSADAVSDVDQLPGRTGSKFEREGDRYEVAATNHQSTLVIVLMQKYEISSSARWRGAFIPEAVLTKPSQVG